MASSGKAPVVPDEQLVLTNPTPTESRRTWTATYPQWGAALTLQSYLDRELYGFEIPLSRDGGLTPWILTDGTASPDERPVLSSCETLRKRALVRYQDGQVKEGWAYGVASVFTYPERRGKGYAAKMMVRLGNALQEKQKMQDGDALFSVLFSDIGKKFYARAGWAAFESTHLELPAKRISIHGAAGELRILGSDDMATLAALDSQLVREKLAQGDGGASTKTQVALLPDVDTMQWHHAREDFVCEHIFNRTPQARGALYAPAGRPGSRVWVVWTRGFYGGVAKPEKNTLYVLRLVVEDETLADGELRQALRLVLAAAQSEAKEWLCPKVEVWNPAPRVRALVEECQDLEARFVVREDEGICALRWFGEGSVDDVEWLASEKYTWC
ncbi:hypothetical protein S40293_08503 [Stachybotrys chartarum IBT 40293]|nr:hypothetical protein S40293_08503 [Stachybotrys chartarum IBT 40293]KFA77894.1 hypothetical protein S40288_02539 [Stachybotrys chartarum IBT 40288]